MTISTIKQPAPLSRPYSSLREKLCMYCLDTTDRNFVITPEEKYQYQWTLIQWIQKYRSTINREIIGKWYWRWFWINQKNKFTSTRMNTQVESSPQNSSILKGKQICMSNLDTIHKKLAITPRNKYQVLWTLILSTRAFFDNQQYFNQNKTPKEISSKGTE